MKQPIYLDNAATSFPKPPQVTEAMIHYMNEVGANPGRSGHQLSLEAFPVVLANCAHRGIKLDIRTLLSRHSN